MVIKGEGSQRVEAAGGKIYDGTNPNGVSAHFNIAVGIFYGFGFGIGFNTSG